MLLYDSDSAKLNKFQKSIINLNRAHPTHPPHPNFFELFRNHHSGRRRNFRGQSRTYQWRCGLRCTPTSAWRRSSGGTGSGRISTTWTGCSLELYAYLTLDNPTNRALFQLSTLPSELRSAILHHGPCRSNEPFRVPTINSENGNRRIVS